MKEWSIPSTGFLRSTETSPSEFSKQELCHLFIQVWRPHPYWGVGTGSVPTITPCSRPQHSPFASVTASQCQQDMWPLNNTTDCLEELLSYTGMPFSTRVWAWKALKKPNVIERTIRVLSVPKMLFRCWSLFCASTVLSKGRWRTPPCWNGRPVLSSVLIHILIQWCQL